jgi:flagellar basal-body rod protein FlgB
MPKLIGKEIDLLARALDFRTMRNSLISANLANADTPGYKAVKVRFEEILKDMSVSEKAQRIRTTHPVHLPMSGGDEPKDPEIVTVSESDQRDGNSVDMDEEMTGLATNQVLYTANVEVLSKILAGLKYAIEEGGGA